MPQFTTEGVSQIHELITLFKNTAEKNTQSRRKSTMNSTIWKCPLHLAVQK